MYDLRDYQTGPTEAACSITLQYLHFFILNSGLAKGVSRVIVLL